MLFDMRSIALEAGIARGCSLWLGLHHWNGDSAFKRMEKRKEWTEIDSVLSHSIDSK